MEREELAEMFDVVVETCLSGNRVHNICDIDEHFYKEVKRVMDIDFNKGNKAFYGAKWTANGLIYTHKMNAKGEFEEIIKSQEQIKAEAFDVIMQHSCLINKGDYKGLLIENPRQDTDDAVMDLSQEEYEILQKAGLE